MRTRRNWRSRYDMCNTITREATENMQLDENKIFHEAFSALHGRRWPTSELTSCIEYNADLCARSFFHECYSTRAKKTINVLHVCYLCLKMYNIGAFHQITECPLLKNLDDNKRKQVQLNHYELPFFTRPW